MGMTKADWEDMLALKEAERDGALSQDPRRWAALSVEVWNLRARYNEKFPAKISAQPKPPRAAEADIREWLCERKRSHNPATLYPGEDDDWKTAEAELGRRIPRDTFRKLRADVLPSEWRRVGRPRSAASTQSPLPKKTRGRYSPK